MSPRGREMIKVGKSVIGQSGSAQTNKKNNFKYKAEKSGRTTTARYNETWKWTHSTSLQNLMQSHRIFTNGATIDASHSVRCVSPFNGQAEAAGGLFDPVLGFAVQHVCGWDALDGHDDVTGTQVCHRGLAAGGDLQAGSKKKNIPLLIN